MKNLFKVELSLPVGMEFELHIGRSKKVKESKLMYNNRVVRRIITEDLLEDIKNKVKDGDTLKVTAKSTPDLSVNISAGTAVNYGKEYRNSATVNLTITANTTTYNRIDNIVIDFNLTSNFVKVVKGTASSTPVAPVVGSNQILLAQVLVGAGVTSIQSSNITDCRKIEGQYMFDSVTDEIVNIKTRINNVSDTIFFATPYDTWTVEITPIRGENFSKVRICGATIVKSDTTVLDRRENLPFKITFSDRISFTCMMTPPEGNYWQGVAKGYACCMYIVNGNSLRIVTHGLTAGINYVQHWSFDSYTLNTELPSDVQAKIKAMNI